MGRRAPAGSKALAHKIQRLGEVQGYRSAAKLLGTSKSTVGRIAKASREGAPLSSVMLRPATLKRWESRLETARTGMAKSTAITQVLKAEKEQLPPSWIAEKMGISTQKYIGLKGQAMRGTLKEPAGFVKKLTSAIRELETEGPHARRYVDEDNNVHWIMFYPSLRHVPKGGDIRLRAMTWEECADWISKVGGGAIYFSVAYDKGKEEYRVYFHEE